MARNIHFKKMAPYKFFLLLSCFFAVIIASGCSVRKPEDKVIHDKTFRLNQKEFVIKLDPPIERTHNSASVFLSIKENWSAEQPWTGIKLQDGNYLIVDVSLKTAEGKKYTAKVIGAAVGPHGKFLEARFVPEILLKEKFTSVHLSASGSIICTKVLWHNFDPHYNKLLS